MKHFLLIILFFLFLNEKLNAVVKNWVSGATWTTTTWSPAGAPGAGDDVLINATNYSINTPVTCASLKFDGNGTTTITITSSVTVAGILDINVSDRNRTFNLNGGASQISVGTLVYPTAGTSTFNIGAGGQLTIASQLTISTRDRMVLTGNAIVNFNGGLIDAAGSITHSPTSRMNIGVRYEVQTASVVLPAGSTIGFISNTTVIETGGGVNLTLANVEIISGLVTFSSPITIAGNWANNGGSFTSGANTLTFTGTGNTIGGSTPTTFNTVIIANAANYTMNNSNSCTSLTFNNGATNSSLTHASGVVFTVNGTVTLNQPSNGTTRSWNINDGTATVSGLITFAGGSGTVTRIALININNGTLNANGGITFVTSASATKQIVMSGGTTGIVNLKGALTVPANSSTLTAGTSSTFNYCDGVAAQTVNHFSVGAYNNLSCNNTSANGVSLSIAISAANVTGDLSVQSGTLSNATFAIVGNAAKTFSVSNGATFKLTGTSAMPTGFGTVSLGVTSTCNFNGIGAQTIAAHNYGNLTSSNTGARTLVSVGTIGVASTFTPGTNVFTITGSTINFNGISAQTIPTFTFTNMIVSTGSTKTLGGAITVNNDLTISSPAILDVSASNFAIIIKRNWINNSSFIYRSGTVSFTGSVAQSIGGTVTNTFYNISILPAVTAINVSANTALDVINDLTFNASPGTLTFTTNNNVTLKSSSGQTARVATITNPTGLTIIGNINVERFAPGGTTGWTLMGNPGLTSLTFASWDDDTYITCAGCPDGYILLGTPFGSIQMYNEAAGGLMDNAARYTEIASPSDPITLGKGYWMYMGDGEFTTNNILYDQTGSIQKGNFSKALTVTGGASADHGWNLLSNPYPSPISWDLVRNGNASVDAEILVYNPDFGAYASYVGGVGTNGLSNTGAIPMGQGFYVHATAATTLNFTEAVKSNTQSALLRLNSNNQVANASIAQTVLRLNVSGGPSNLEDETVIHFNTNATIAWDTDWDAHKLAGFDYSAPSISTLVNGIEYSINGLPALSGTTTIPLLVKTGTSSTYTIGIGSMDNFPHGACLQLTDLLLNTTHDLSTSGYVCDLSDTATVPRFMLTVTINNNLTLNTITTQNTCAGNGLITAIGNDAGPWNYYWKDATGSVIHTSLNKSSEDTLTSLIEGTYSVEVNTVGGCNSASQSFIINAPILPLSDFTASLDTVALVNGIASVSFTNSSLNADTYFWNFGDAANSTGVSPQHDYSLEGNYQIELIASNSGCISQASSTKEIVVVSPVLQITGVVSDLVCVNHNEGNIIATGNNAGPWDYTWLDGANAVVRAVLAKSDPDTLSNLASGVYTLKMRTVGAASEITETYIVNAPSSPNASFTMDADTVDLNTGFGTVSFINTSTSSDSYFWDFGDSTYSQLPNPSHTYSVGGTYVVSMFAYNAACGDSVATYKFIEVINAVVGLKNIESASSVSVGQNSTGEVFVKFGYEVQTPVTISIYNTLGEKIMNDLSLNTMDEIIKLNIPEMSEQLILVEIKADGHETAVKKIIKRK